MNIHKKVVKYSLPLRAQPYSTEGPQGYLLRLAELNLLGLPEIKAMGIGFNYDTLIAQGLMPDFNLDPNLHKYISEISQLWASENRVWNEQHSRYCPMCLSEHGHWKVEWELNFYDVCHHHGVWLVDKCSSCGKKLSWNRTQLLRCSCNANLGVEEAKTCPSSMQMIAASLSAKVLQTTYTDMPGVLDKTNVEQTQRLIRYLGNYMSLASGKNPLKMRNAGDLNQSWPVTTLAAEVINNWPHAFHQGLDALEKTNRSNGRPSLNDVFGAAYHYVFKALKEKPFEELRLQFELWITQAWKGGIAKRNKRLTSILMKEAAWVPASIACDFLGISHQRLDLLIREGTIEGEMHFSETGRKFVMVRRDNLQQVKDHLFGLIDMSKARKLLGLEKRRMRLLLTLIFTDAKKLGTSPGSPWAISRLEVNKLLELTSHLELVSIPDEDCVSLGHVLKYWTWSNDEIASLIFSVKSQDIEPVNILDTVPGIAAWNFKESALKNWKLKNQNGMGTWLTITQAAKVLGVKEQVTYELVSLGFLKSEVMPNQIKRGTRIKRSSIDEFNDNYIFATKIAESKGCSSVKVISHLRSFQIEPISGPQTNGARQVLYKRDQILNSIGDI